MNRATNPAPTCVTAEKKIRLGAATLTKSEMRKYSAAHRFRGGRLPRIVASASSATTAPAIDRLEEAGLVARRPDSADRRGTLVARTASGFAPTDGTMAARAGNEKPILAGLSTAEPQTLPALLAKLIPTLPTSERSGGVFPVHRPAVRGGPSGSADH